MEISRATALGILGRLAPLDDGQIELLKIPDTLFDIGGPDSISFSTDEGFGAQMVEGCFLAGLPLPKKIPDYAIGLSQKGNKTYCIFVDKSRRLMAYAQVAGIYSEGDWDALVMCIKSAKEFKEKNAGRRFRFIMSSEDSVRAV